MLKTTKLLLVSILLFRLSFLTFCQRKPLGAESVSLAGVSVVLENPWAGLTNPALLAGIETFSVSTSLEQKYLMKELGHYSLAMACPAGSGCLDLCYAYSGWQSFREQLVCLSYGKELGRNISAGVGLVYILQATGDPAASIHMLGFSLGSGLAVSDRLSLAVSAFNPFNWYFKSKSYSNLPCLFRFGLLYKSSPSFRIVAELEKDLEYALMFKGGCEYRFRDSFFIRCGLNCFPVSFSLGAAFRRQRLLIEFASAYHQYLGFTPTTSFRFDIR